jgi:hypothetical protein
MSRRRTRALFAVFVFLSLPFWAGDFMVRLANFNSDNRGIENHWISRLKTCDNTRFSLLHIARPRQILHGLFVQFYVLDRICPS